MAETTFTFKDATGATKTAVAGQNGSSQLAPAAVLYDSSGAELKGRKAAAASLPVVFSTEDLAALTPPAGGATAANQATQITSLASILAKLSADPSTETTLAAILAKIIASPATSAKQDALAALIGEVQASPTSLTLLDRLKTIATSLAGTLAISAVSLPLPSGAATSANQTTGNTSLATLITQTDGIEGSLSSIDGKLVSGPSTAAKQDTGNTSLASLDTKTPALGQAVAGSSTPVVLPAAQITTLTPPAAITGFATETTLAAQSAKLPAALGQTTKAASLSVALASNQDALPITDNSGSLTVDNGGTFAVQAAQSGTWNVTNVSGTVSLPTGAATAAKQPALGTAGSASADVITVQGIASGTPQLIAAAPGTLTAKNGTITTGATAQTLAASNASRKYLFIQNQSIEALYVSFTGTAVADKTSMKLNPGDAYETAGNYITTQAVSVIGATTGSAFYAVEG